MEKRSYIIFILSIILFLGMVSAISTNIRDSYDSGETMITEISGSVLEPITSSDVTLLRNGHIPVPFDFDVKKIGENYYLWLLAPSQIGNYTLKISGISTYVSGTIKEIDYEKNFSVFGNLTDYYVKPGFISTDKDFQIKVVLNGDYDKLIDLEFLEKSNYTLKPGENNLEFSISKINESGLFNLNIGKFGLPVYALVVKTETILGNITEIEDSNESGLTNLTNLISLENLTSEEKKVIEEERLKHLCSTYPGNICNASQKCTKEPIETMDGSCCVEGYCRSNEEGSGSKSWIGYLIVAVLLIAGVFFWIKYKKVKKEENPIARRALLTERKVP